MSDRLALREEGGDYFIDKFLLVELGSAFDEDLGASRSKEEIVLPELDSAFDKDLEASGTEEGNVLSDPDEPDCVLVEVNLDPVRRDFDLSESDFESTSKSKYDDGSPDVKEIKGFCLIAMNPSC